MRETNLMPPAQPSGQLRWQSALLVGAILPLCGGAVVGFAMRTRPAEARGQIFAGVLISLALAVAARLARSATWPAAIAGGVLTADLVFMSIASGDGVWVHSPLLPLLTLFLLTLAATKFGRRRKEQLGVAEERRGRGASQVVANLGAAGLTAALALSLSITGDSSQTGDTYLSLRNLWPLMIAAVLAEATADTLSSELGEVLGGDPFLITTGRRVSPGTDGAVSVAGSLAGCMGAAVIVLAAIPTLRLSLSLAFAAGASAIGGLFFDSILGATLERSHWLNNDAVNFLSTLAAALMAWGLFAWLHL